MNGLRTRKDRGWERREKRNKGQRKGKRKEANGRMKMEGWIHGKWLDE